MCVPVTTTVLFHRPVLSYPYRRPLSFSAFAASRRFSFLFSLPLPRRHPSPCLQQPYKPWSSAGASSFTRAMYPDVSEGRNFASVCVNHFYLSRSLLPSLSLSRPLHPYRRLALPPSSSFTCLSVLVRFHEYIRATRRARVRRAYTCACTCTERDVQTRTRGKIRSVGTSDYVSERYPE